MFSYALIAFGSAIGGMLRFWMSGLVSQMTGDIFPWGTLIINVTGSFIIGLFATLTGTEGRIYVPPAWRQFFMIGICGGYTTFSSFSLQTFDLSQSGQFGWAAFNVGGSVVLCLLGVWLGHTIALALNEGRWVLRREKF